MLPGILASTPETQSACGARQRGARSEGRTSATRGFCHGTPCSCRISEGVHGRQREEGGDRGGGARGLKPPEQTQRERGAVQRTRKVLFAIISWVAGWYACRTSPAADQQRPASQGRIQTQCQMEKQAGNTHSGADPRSRASRGRAKGAGTHRWPAALVGHAPARSQTP